MDPRIKCRSDILKGRLSPQPGSVENSYSYAKISVVRAIFTNRSAVEEHLLARCPDDGRLENRWR